jgi:hypothetical protein
MRFSGFQASHHTERSNLMATRGKFSVSLLLVLILLLALSGPISAGAAKPAPVAVRLTSITIDPEDASGATTNAPGAWSTNLADPLCQAGVMSHGDFLNGTQPGIGLGEISIPLEPGINIFSLVGHGVFSYNDYYGAVLFFDGQQTPPQVAVYNANGGRGHFQVQPAGTQIMGGANGGLFFDVAPGSSVYTAADGTQVKVQSFHVNAFDSTADRVSCYQIGADGIPDMVATLTLKVTPPKK